MFPLDHLSRDYMLWFGHTSYYGSTDHQTMNANLCQMRWIIYLYFHNDAWQTILTLCKLYFHHFAGEVIAIALGSACGMFLIIALVYLGWKLFSGRKSSPTPSEYEQILASSNPGTPVIPDPTEGTNM